MTDRFLGVFVHLYSFQVEGVTPVLDELERVGATTIATTTRLARPTSSRHGMRVPPLHRDGHRRVLARARWGSRSPHVEWFSAYAPNASLFPETSYQPFERLAPAGLGEGLLREVIDSAHRRGLMVHLQTFALRSRPSSSPSITTRCPAGTHASCSDGTQTLMKRGS